MFLTDFFLNKQQTEKLSKWEINLFKFFFNRLFL